MKKTTITVLCLAACLAAADTKITWLADVTADRAETVTGVQSNRIRDAAAHIVRADNPHGVTAAQIGALTAELDPVANAALAAYAAYWPPNATASSWFNFVTNSGAITITGYGGGGDVVIPDYINGLPVTEIGANAFMASGAASIGGAGNVVTVGDYTFYSCGSLTSVSLPQVQTVGEYAFASCDSLTSISLPQVQAVGLYAFEFCGSLTSVSLPQAQTVGDSAFYSCASLASLYFDDDAPTIGDEVFAGITPNQVTIYVTNPQATGWGDRLGGMPVVRLPLYADAIYQAGELVATTGHVAHASLADADGYTTQVVMRVGSEIATNRWAPRVTLPDGILTNGYAGETKLGPMTMRSDGVNSLYDLANTTGSSRAILGDGTVYGTGLSRMDLNASQIFINGLLYPQGDITLTSASVSSSRALLFYASSPDSSASQRVGIKGEGNRGVRGQEYGLAVYPSAMSWNHDFGVFFAADYRTGFGTRTPQASIDIKPKKNVQEAKFYGSGLDDLSQKYLTGSTYTGAGSKTIKVEIDGTGTPDTFRWSDDEGVNWRSSGITITAADQIITNGINVRFNATTGHTLGNYWLFTALDPDPQIWRNGDGVELAKLSKDGNFSLAGTNTAAVVVSQGPVFFGPTIGNAQLQIFTDGTNTYQADVNAATNLLVKSPLGSNGVSTVWKGSASSFESVGDIDSNTVYFVEDDGTAFNTQGIYRDLEIYNAIPSPYTTTVSLVENKTTYHVNVYTNMILEFGTNSLNITGKEVEFKLRLEVTETNIPSMEFIGTAFDVEPEILVTGIWEFAVSTVDGVKYRAKQTWPECCGWRETPCTLNQIYSNISAAFNIKAWASATTIGATNYITYILPANDSYLIRNRTAGNGPNIPPTYMEHLVIKRGHYHTDRILIYTTTKLIETYVGKYSESYFVFPADPTVKFFELALVVGEPFASSGSETVYVDCTYVRRLNSNERAAYEAGWRP